MGEGMTASRVDGQTLRGGSLPVRYANLVKLPHTVFALPFALVGVLYASLGSPVTWVDVVLVVVAFSAARFSAMGFNRMADRDLDAMNPRTRNREIPAGRLSYTHAALSVGLAAVVFIAAAGLLNLVCLLLSPVALAWVLAYSYTKRFTSWSHLWLGGALAMAPVGGYLAITGTWSTPWWTLASLACSVATWVAGFDIFYALQDEDFDRDQGLRSAVVLLGQRRSITIAKSLHGVTLAGLALFGYGAGSGTLYWVGWFGAAAILTWEHRLVRPGDLSRIDAAFFRMNGIMSIVFLLGMLGDRVL